MKKFTLLLLLIVLHQFTSAQWVELNGVGFEQPASQVPYFLSYDSRSYSQGGYGYVWEALTDDGINFYHNELHKYNPSTGLWTALASYPEHTMFSVTFNINGENYCGISFESSAFWKLDSVNNTWIRLADFPGGTRDFTASFVINGKGYVVGGSYAGSLFNDCWEYDPGTNSWTQKNNFGGTPRSRAVSWSNNSNAFVGLGQDSTGFVSDMWRYNPVNDSWTPRTAFTGTSGLSSNNQTFSVGHKNYLHTDTQFWEFDDSTNGWSSRPMLDTLGDGAVAFSDGLNGYLLYIQNGLSLNKYNTVTDTWSNIMQGSVGIPNQSNLTSIGIVFDNKAHLNNYQSESFTYDPVVDLWTKDTMTNISWMFSQNNKGYAMHNGLFQEYDPATGSWTNKTIYPAGQNFNKHLFLLNGISYNIFDSNYVSKVWTYDVISDQWTFKTNLPGGLVGGGGSVSFAIGNYGYFGLGETQNSCSTDSIYKYDPVANTWTFETLMPLGERFAGIGLADSLYGYVGFGVQCPGAADGDNGNVYIYDPVTQIWSLTTSLGGRNSITGFCINNRIYMGGGWERTCQSCNYNYVPFDFYYMDTTYFSNHHLVSGTTFLDLNLNGVQDTNEVNYYGGSVHFSPDSAQFVITGNGNYYYYLPNGNYSVSLQPPYGYYVTTTPSTYNIVMNNSNISNINFGIYPENVVSGYTYLDKNVNGIRDAADSIAGSVRIFADTSNTFTYSDYSTGKYSVVLANGTFAVHANPPFNCHQTSLPPVYGLTLSNDTASNIDFGFYYNYSMSGFTYVDVNQNGIYDSTDILISNVGISVTPSVTSLISNSAGFYSFTAADTNYTITPVLPQGFHLTSLPTSYGVNGISGNIDSLDFGIYPDSAQSARVEPTLSTGFIRCNTVVPFYLNGRNNGVDTSQGILRLTPDSTLTFNSSVPPPDSIVNNEYFWHYSGLGPFSYANLITAYFLLPGAGTTIHCNYSMTALDGSGAILDSKDFSFSRLVSCAFDPNEKRVNPEQNQVNDPGEWLNYEVHFQNTGNDTAFNVVVIDTLNLHLDVSSLEIVHSTHSYVAEIRNGNILVMTFGNILLADSNINLPGSEGDFIYRIRSLPGTPMNTIVSNTAYIYFDYNLPVVTNTTMNVIDLTTSIQEKENTNEIFAFPNPAWEFTRVNLPHDGEYFVQLIDMNGKVLKNYGIIKSANLKLETKNLSPGNYILKVTDKNNGVVRMVKIVISRE